jgi:hypothetical protein
MKVFLSAGWYEYSPSSFILDMLGIGGQVGFHFCVISEDVGGCEKLVRDQILQDHPNFKVKILNMDIREIDPEIKGVISYPFPQSP